MERVKIVVARSDFMKNKILCLVLILPIVLFMFTSCDNKEVTKIENFKITTVNFVQYDFVKNIVKDKAEVEMILSPQSDIHSFSPSLSNINAIKDSNLFIYNDMLSDKWVDDIISSVDIEKTTILPLAKYSYLIEDMENKEADISYKDDNYDMYDEHIWLSLQNARLMVKAISDTICTLDKSNEAFYKDNASTYIEKLENLHNEYIDMVENSSKKTIVVADQFPFKYMTNDYNLSYKAVFTSCSHERDANPSSISSIIDYINKEKIKTVFYTELSDSKIANTICKQTGADKKLLHSVQKVTKEEIENGASYLNYMKQNLTNLREALN